MTHKSAGTVAELYLSNAPAAANPGSCNKRAGASVTVPPKKPPAPGTIRRRLFGAASQTYPVAGLAPPARDPAEAYPSPTMAGRGGGRAKPSGQRLGYSQNVSHPSRGRGGMERSLPPARRCAFPRWWWWRLQCFCERGIRARTRASAPLRGFSCSLLVHGQSVTEQKILCKPRVPSVFVYFWGKGLNVPAIACTHCMARFCKGNRFLFGRRSSFRNPLPKGRQ
ncbi:hypothetical protein SEVIR_9G475850v4 [Setaria viridis]|uniref:Uncharacterized protein n=1 Tax=Setaria viridis TaxID=4556 RepID=A0A4U6TIK3_SETVI|nr:hypothetical protein SEVIR_9G475850v2 [Setaria viridis]